jgi:hypothetical protein
MFIITAARTSDHMIQVGHGFPQYFQANAGIVALNRQRPLYFFQVHHSLIVVRYDAI